MDWGTKSKLYKERPKESQRSIYSLLLVPHQRNKLCFTMGLGTKSRLYIGRLSLLFPYNTNLIGYPTL